MDNSEYLQCIDDILNKIDETLEDLDLDIDLEISDGKLVIVFDDNQQYILNSQSVNQQLWLAEPGGGWHYDFKDGQFICDKRGLDILKTLELLMSEKLSQKIVLK
ncbi:MAG: iron donor protein CyaY [Gammaproteobacteria bacterium]|nr:iron donor protein CyaY [Gammaproteobacteria bacterium]